jgi:hypothetical protein
MLRFVLFSCAGLLCSGSTILEYVNLSNGAGSTIYAEQFVTPAGGPWNNITFSFLDGTTPEANGTAYLSTDPPPSYFLSDIEAAGLPQAPALNGAYVFDPSVTLLPGTAYFILLPSAADVSGGFFRTSGEPHP